MIGGSQEYGLRGGTENVASIAGAGLAAEIGSKNLKKNAQKLKELKTYFIKGLEEIYPSAIINGHLTNSLPGLINVSFPGFRSDILMTKLDRVNIAVSSGSACGSGSIKPSSVLSNIGVSEKLLEDSDYLAISSGGIGADTEVLNQLVDAPLDSLDGRSVRETDEDTVSSLGQQISLQQNTTIGLKDFYATLQSQHLAITGVNIDEESIRMIAYQRAFQASSRVIAAASEMLELLVAL